MPPDTDGKYDGMGETLPMCKYKCTDGKRDVQNNPKCLSNFGIFLDNIGGTPMLVIIGVASILSLIVISYFFYSRNKDTDQNDLEHDENLYKMRLAA
jgi:hypothetical protein